MSEGTFQIDPSGVLNCAARTRGSARVSRTYAERVTAAEVPGQAWGLLGHMLPLHADYERLLGELAAHSTAIQEFLAWAADTIGETAESYRRVESDLARSFTDIGRGLDGEPS